MLLDLHFLTGESYEGRTRGEGREGMMGTTIESDWECTRLKEELADARNEIAGLKERTYSVMQAHQDCWEADLAKTQANNLRLREALGLCDEAMEYMSEYDIPLCLPEKVKAALAQQSDNQALF